MDSLAAVPGTGPNTSPLPVIRPGRPKATWEQLPDDRAVIFGILNVTPDSFSDGGDYNSLDSAISHGLRMHYNGADVIDIGGESTRPGAEAVDPEVERERILPVVEAMVKAGALVSVDTRNADTALAAIEAGAAIINDVSGVSTSDQMIKVVADSGVHYVLMHCRGDARTMDGLTKYDNVVDDVIAELEQVRDRFRAAGVSDEKIILDPGLGFAKSGDQNWELLANLRRFTALGHKVLVGTSRKRFLGSLLSTAGKAAAPAERDHATTALTALAITEGVWGVRVHNVAANADAAKVAARLRQAGHPAKGE